MKSKLLRAAGILAAVAPTSRGAAQITDPVLKRMWSIGMDSSHTWELAQTLFDSIGPRLTGTPQGTQASDWVIKMYKSWGIDAKREQYGTWRGWRRGYSHIDLIKPRVRSLEATTLGYSPGTDGKEVIGTTIILPMVKDSNEFVKWLPNARGKFVLISAAYPTCRPEEEWTAQATPASREKMDTAIVTLVNDWTTRIRNTGYNVTAGNPTGALGTRIEKAGAVGVIVSNFASPLGGAWGTYTVYDTKNKTALGIAMSCEDYGLLYRLTERKQSPQLRVNEQSEFLGEVPVANTLGTIVGSEKPNEYVMLSSHFDSWDGSQGATDNGTGTIAMMEAMRILKQAYPRPKRTIISGHWPGESRAERLSGVRVRSSGDREGHAGIVQSGQRHGTNRQHVGRRPSGRRRRSHGGMARQASTGIPTADSLQRRRCSGDRRHGQRVVRLLWRAGVRTELAGVGLRHVHAPHESRQLRQDRI
jgi:hypothetical protein